MSTLEYADPGAAWRLRVIQLNNRNTAYRSRLAVIRRVPRKTFMKPDRAIAPSRSATAGSARVSRALASEMSRPAESNQRRTWPAQDDLPPEVAASIAASGPAAEASTSVCT